MRSTSPALPPTHATRWSTASRPRYCWSEPVGTGFQRSGCRPSAPAVAGRTNINNNTTASPRTAVPTARRRRALNERSPAGRPRRAGGRPRRRWPSARTRRPRRAAPAPRRRRSPAPARPRAARVGPRRAQPAGRAGEVLALDDGDVGLDAPRVVERRQRRAQHADRGLVTRLHRAPQRRLQLVSNRHSPILETTATDLRSIGNDRAVRWVLAAVILLLTATPAAAADDDIGLLRGLGVTTRDGWPGASVTLPDGSALFAANDGVHGRELWRTDGTPGGTRMVDDLVPGPAASGPGGPHRDRRRRLLRRHRRRRRPGGVAHRRHARPARASSPTSRPRPRKRCRRPRTCRAGRSTRSGTRSPSCYPHFEGYYLAAAGPRGGGARVLDVLGPGELHDLTLLGSTGDACTSGAAVPCTAPTARARAP